MMLSALFGNKTSARILPWLHQHAKGNANGIARELKIPLNMVQKQLERLKNGGILSSHFEGKSKFYYLDPKQPIYPALKKILQITSEKKSTYQKTPDPADGSDLPLSKRVSSAEQLFRDAVTLNPFSPPKPFVKSFKSYQEYEKWKKAQTNPWLV